MSLDQLYRDAYKDFYPVRINSANGITTKGKMHWLKKGTFEIDENASHLNSKVVYGTIGDVKVSMSKSDWESAQEYWRSKN